MYTMKEKSQSLFLDKVNNYSAARSRVGKHFPLMILIAIIISVSGCATSNKKPAQLIVSYQAATNLNIDVNGNSAPLVVVVYYLNSPVKFNTANFFDLYNRPLTTLSNNLMDKNEIE